MTPARTQLRALLCFMEQTINNSSVVEAIHPVTCKGKEIGAQMMCLEQWTTFILKIHGIISNTH